MHVLQFKYALLCHVPFLSFFCYEMLVCSISIEFSCYLSSTELDQISRCACIWFDVVGKNVYNKLLKRMPVFSGTLPFRPRAVEANGCPLHWSCQRTLPVERQFLKPSIMLDHRGSSDCLDSSCCTIIGSLLRNIKCFEMAGL